MKARYPLKEDTVSQPGKWTTTEEGIQYLRELVVVDTRTVIRPLPPVWRSFVQSAPTSRASNLAMMNWSAIEAPTVYRLVCHLWRFKENLSSPSLLQAGVSAVERPFHEVERVKSNGKDPSPSLSLQANISATKGCTFPAEREWERGHVLRAMLWFDLRDHGEAMRKWDGAPRNIPVSMNISLSVLVWAGRELIFFIVASMGLCFGFVLETVLIIQGCFNCC